ncbi:hypothetical protein D3C85_1811450 [compost metagenome]
MRAFDLFLAQRQQVERIEQPCVGLVVAFEQILQDRQVVLRLARVVRQYCDFSGRLRAPGLVRQQLEKLSALSVQ